MATIWKYEIPAGTRHEIEIPVKAEFLSVGIQDTCPVMWFQVEPSPSHFDKNFRTFEAIGTGWGVDHYGKYLGTVQDHVHDLVWHVYEIKMEGDSIDD